MKKKILDRIDFPLFTYFVILVLYIIWTKFNGIHYNEEFCRCYDNANSKYERRQCLERYGNKK